jgi:Zn-dependent metalloprotease
MIRDGELTMRLERADMLIAGRRHERYMQTLNGVPVYGGDVARQVDGKGLTISIFGTVYEGIKVETEPTLSAEEAKAVAERDSGVKLGPLRKPRLVVLPREDNTYALAYQVRVATPLDLTLYFIDAHSGEVLQQRSDAQRQQAAVGQGTGVLGDRKKISTTNQAGGFTSADSLRPPVIETNDMRGNLNRTLNFLNGFLDLSPADLATDSDNDWGDVSTVDGHVYAGWTYDYFFKRFGRRGLDNDNIPIIQLTHTVRREDVFNQPNSIIGLFYVNAAYFGDGIMMYGEGLPPNVTLGGDRYDFFSGALDVVAHELAHGVTDYSSQLIYQNESGALNEAFSDIMGTAVEWYFQDPGNGPMRAEYLMGEDISSTPFRSMSNPESLGSPDHFSRRFLGSADNGGVHINSGIANHAYYLAIEGGTNRTSGLSVQGVGSANREQMERIFYRAFTQMLPANARFTTARAATIQAARDLFGANSPAVTAVTQAWTAVGVN